MLQLMSAMLNCWNHMPSGDSSGHDYDVQGTSGYAWAFTRPYTNHGPGGKASHDHEFTFSGIGSQVSTIMKQKPAMNDVERRFLARETMRFAFEHLAPRILIALQKQPVKCVVVSGGVASNGYLRYVLQDGLDKHGYANVELVFPPLRFCTDNAAMIAWTGLEMWHSGWQSELAMTPLQKWSLDPAAADGGILGVDCWARHPVVSADT